MNNDFQSVLKFNVMREYSSWGLIEPEIKPPKAVKKSIQKNVMAQLTITRFIGSVVDLYLGKIGQTIVGLAETFELEEDDDEQDRHMY